MYNANDMFKAVEIEINSRCNLACSYCPNSIDARGNHGIMKPDLYEKIMKELCEINFSGRVSYDFYNEPMLCPYLDEYVAMTKEYLPDVTTILYSNGTFLTEKRFYELLGCGVDSFVITKHEGESEPYTFDKTFAALSSDEKQRVDYRNHQEMTKFNRGGTLPHFHDREVKPLTPCYIPSSMFTVTHEGHVLPCFEDVKEAHVMGDVKEQSILEVWNSEKFRDFRYKLQKGLRHMFKACQNCDRYEVLDPS